MTGGPATRRGLAAAVLAAVISIGGMHPLGPGAAVAAGAAQAGPDDIKIRRLLERIEQIAPGADSTRYLELLAPSADRTLAAEFAELEFRDSPLRMVIQERARQALAGTLPGNGYSLTVDAFMEFGTRGRVATWQLDIRRIDDDWRITAQERVSAVENLYRLSLNPTKQFDAHNFTLISEDLELTLVEGAVFVVETEQGVTGLVLLGQGQMNFHPAPETEKGQVRIFAGSEMLESRFDAAFIRTGTLEMHADPAVLKTRPVDPRELKRAEQVFREESGKSFVVDLGDLTRDTWSILPGYDDFLAEIRTRRFDTLTYARSAGEAEDVSFFERRRRRNIAAYASRAKLAARGRFYNEDDLATFDVLNYDIDITSQPDRQWIDGRTVMRIRIRAPGLGQLTMRLANSLVVRSVQSNQFGRLFNLRVSNQNTILVNLPTTVARDTEMTLTIEYSGRLEPQRAERETVAVAGQQDFDDASLPATEATYLYSNLSYWYPQGMVTDYATANIQINVPVRYACLATGEQAPDSPRTIPGADAARTRKVYVFSAERPLRYLAFVVSRLTRADRWTVAFDRDPAADALTKTAPGVNGAPYNNLDLIVEAHRGQAGRGKELAERTVDVVQFYESIIGDSPYSTFSLALVESTLPGGHSPGYFAILNQPLLNTGVSWRNDPASFASYPEFFLAHEVAHQWWGQAVGWRNYHEQWLSEGFAQYFAALYAEKFRGEEVFGNVMRQMRRWALAESDQGAVYLGYRIGHIKNEGRAFRAVIYNKGAAVLHMLRRLLGDEAFFRGIRRFYRESRFTKVGTDDLRQAMEAESGQPLDRFFERWIYNSSLPQVSFRYRVEAAGTGSSAAQVVVLHFEQTGEIFDLPVTVTLQYADRKPVDVLVPVTDQVVERRVPLQGTLRTAEISRDDGTVAEITVLR